MASTENSSASLLHLLHRAGQCADELFAANIGASALTPRQYEVLNAVNSSEDPSQTFLVDRTGIDRSTLADIVRRLVEKGFLERNRTRRDARMYAVNLTADGKTILARSEPIVRQTNELLMANLSSEERAITLSALSRIITSAKIG